MMQQRRMKRLAGPAFYLNVKYDQNSMYTQMNDANAQSGDKLGLNDQTGRIAYENFDIKEGELVFTKKKGCLSLYYGRLRHLLPERCERHYRYGSK